jgi:hypothetical protein
MSSILRRIPSERRLLSDESTNQEERSEEVEGEADYRQPSLHTKSPASGDARQHAVQSSETVCKCQLEDRKGGSLRNTVERIGGVDYTF